MKKTLQPNVAIAMATLADRCFAEASYLGSALVNQYPDDPGISDLVLGLVDSLESTAFSLHKTLATLILWAQRHPSAGDESPKRPEPAATSGGDTPPPTR